VILMAGWHGRLGVRLRVSAHAPLRVHDLRHTARGVCSPRSTSKHSSITTTFDRYGHLLPGMDDALARRWMGSDGRLSRRRESPGTP
jgi:integrase